MNTDFINERKRELKLTNQMIADSTGIALSTLDKITAGVNTNPKLDTMRALAKALQCTMEELVSSCEVTGRTHDDECKAEFLPDVDPVGSRIKEARKRCGYTQQELADMLGLKKATICGYETGIREPDINCIRSLARELGVPGDYLLGIGVNKKSLTAEAFEIARSYDRLNERGRSIIRALMNEVEGL